MTARGSVTCAGTSRGGKERRDVGGGWGLKRRSQAWVGQAPKCHLICFCTPTLCTCKVCGSPGHQNHAGGPCGPANGARPPQHPLPLARLQPASPRGSAGRLPLVTGSRTKVCPQGRLPVHHFTLMAPSAALLSGYLFTVLSHGHPGPWRGDHCPAAWGWDSACPDQGGKQQERFRSQNVFVLHIHMLIT